MGMRRQQHDHNLRSAPHSNRRVRASKRTESNNRADTATQPRIITGTRTQQQHRGSETSGPATRHSNSPTRDVSSGDVHLQTIAAQQQQMQQMQQMMFAMQNQMTALQSTIATMAKQPAPAPLITAPTSTDTAAIKNANAPSGASNKQQSNKSSSRTAGTAASGSPLPQQEKESTTTQQPSISAESAEKNPAPQPVSEAVANSTSRGSKAPHKSQRDGLAGLERKRGSRRRPASGPPLIRSMAGVARKSLSKAKKRGKASAFNQRRSRSS